MHSCETQLVLTRIGICEVWEIPNHVAREMDRTVEQAYQTVLGIGDLTMAQAKQIFFPM